MGRCRAQKNEKEKKVRKREKRERTNEREGRGGGGKKMEGTNKTKNSILNLGPPPKKKRSRRTFRGEAKSRGERQLFLNGKVGEQNVVLDERK